MYNIWFDVCAVCILLIILISFYTKNNIPIFQNKIFVIMVWLTLASTVCDLLGGVYQNHYEAIQGLFSTTFFNVLNYGYFITRNATSFIYTCYIIALLNISGRLRFRFATIFLPYIVDLLLIALTPFKQFVFYVDQNGVYHRGDYLFILYGIAVYYLLLSIYLVTYFRESIPKLRRAALYSFVVLALVTVCIQGYYPTLMVEGFGTSLCILLIYLTIQRPEEILDGSSGLLNKSAFITMSSIDLKQKTESGIILIILDNYSFLETSLGFENTNNLIKAVGNFLNQLSKKSSLYRIKDNHICLKLDHYDPLYIAQLIRDITSRFKKSWEVLDFSIMLPIHVSCICCPKDASTPEEVLELIDMISEEAHNANHTLIEASNVPRTEKQRRLNIESIVKNALHNHCLEVVYQPIYSTKEKRFVSAEALLRLHDPAMGYIPPDEFIPIAEKNGAIVKMGQFVLDSVCQFIAANNLSQYGIEYIEVNLSIVECLQDNLVKHVLEPLQKYNLNAKQINLEITETASNTLPETADRNLFELSGKGILLSLDDYGTGYSNISRMLSLPLEIIKIDKSIVQAAFLSAPADIVLTSTVQMLSKLDKHILAEGVETKEQADYMIQLGCDFIQGYYYSKPLKSEDFLTCLKKQKQVSPS